MGDFDFIEHYGEETEVNHEDQLPDNDVPTSLNCAFVGVGGGGGKLAKAFLDLGFNKTLLINTTAKDQPADTVTGRLRRFGHHHAAARSAHKNHIMEILVKQKLRDLGRLGLDRDAGA